MSSVAVSKDLSLDGGDHGLVTTARRTIWAPSLVAYLVCMFLLAHSSAYHQGLLLVAAAYAMLALSLDLVAGATGLYSLGHAGLFAIGAYGTAVLAERYDWNVFVALPVVVVAGAIAGLLIGALSLRVSGLYFAITTLIFSIIVTVLVSNMSITGGYEGLSSPTFPSFSRSVTSALGSSLTWAVAGCLLLVIVVVWSIRSSALYPVLLAIRDSERFATSAGVRTSATKIVLFGLSAAIAGLAGWAFCFLGYITPSQFDTTASINVLVMVIVGGMNTRLGPIIGAAFVGLFPVVVSINSLWQEVIYGSIFIVVIVFFPEGFVGIVSRAGDLFVSTRPWRGRRLTRSGGSTSSVRSPASSIPPSPAATDREPEADADGPVPAQPAPSPPPEMPVFQPDGTLDGDHGASPALEARGVSFSYSGGVRVLDDVDLLVRRGSIHGLIGPNGSGKTTLVDILSGALVPEAGTITVNGRRAERLPPWRRVDLGLMRSFQTAAMVDELTTRENVKIGLFNRYPRIGLRSPVWPMVPSARRDSRTMAAAAAEALSAVGVGRPWTRTRVANVPHGVAQLTQLAAVCVGRPSVVILDEPLAGLSSEEVQQVASILRGLRTAGVTVVVVEHQTRFVFDVCDEVTVLAAGKVVKTGPAAEVRVDTRVRDVYLGQ